jgi:ABC-type iron transport system FetAB ATPase subunit
MPDHDPAPVIRLDNLRVDAGPRTLISGLSCDLLAGRFTALSGPSGLGKTSVLRAIAGLIDPAGGTVTFKGAAPRDIGWPAFRRQVIYLSQYPVLLPGTVRENLARPFEFKACKDRFDLSRAVALLAELKLPETILDQQARTLSGGQQQRVCLARALQLSPAMLLLDEPTSSLDEAATAAIESVLLDRRDRDGLSAALVTHDKDQMARLCQDRVDLSLYSSQLNPEIAP